MTSSGSQVITDPTDPTRSIVVGGGTAGDDTVSVRPGGDGIELVINGTVVGSFPTGGEMVILGQGGDDVVTLDKSIDASAIVFGCGGSDRLTSGSGSAVLIGGANADTLVGNNSRDLLIGGAGGDTLRASNGDDVLVSGTTSYDAPTVSNVSALRAILAEWTGAASYSTRIGHLSGMTAGGANGSYLLARAGPGRTVFADASVDTLMGANGQDWFLSSTGSDTSDNGAGEAISAL